MVASVLEVGAEQVVQSVFLGVQVEVDRPLHEGAVVPSVEADLNFEEEVDLMGEVGSSVVEAVQEEVDSSFVVEVVPFVVADLEVVPYLEVVAALTVVAGPSVEDLEAGLVETLMMGADSFVV